MAEWQQLLQSVFIGLIFSYLLAKLISIVVSFKEENLSISRNDYADLIPEQGKTKLGSGDDELSSRVSEEEGSTAAQKGSVGSDEDDDDWEGVESTDLDEAFSAATVFVTTAAADRLSQKVSSDMQLQLYGLYKIATEGPCSSPQPSALKMTARAKWQAWQKLGTMTPEDAMEKYIELVTELYPSWLASSTTNKERSREIDTSNADAKGPMGPVFSSFVYEEETGNEMEMDAIHAFAREGEVDNLLKCIDSGVSVNLKDSEGRTPLHWAVDRGQFNMVELLIRRNANVNAKDNEGQTPLHYAAVCEREAIAEYLVKHNADMDAMDEDGNSPSNICNSKWSWMQRTSKPID